ncbi:unnamed protein product [Prorocentrum cordatum]|uniref:Uncharacterized protein n=1 Tax=Prorocentrum cordatum TaxID=2364126 RepID=A0ABN9VPS1_9DINO|nr:unnamed protein product [Polarella glacialis]
MTGWNGAFVALEYSNSWDVSSTSLYRQFPGFVMDLTEKNGVRTYDPKDRDWFSSWKDRTPYQMSTSDVGRYVTEVTAPYLDRFGNGYLISLTASVPTDSGFTGVAGTDILVAPLADLVSDLKLRQTGVVHLYHVGTGIVASSPQWSADPEEG